MATPGGRIAPSITASWLHSEAPIVPLDQIPCWGALVSEDPFATSDPLSTEILGAAYRRVVFLYEFADTVLRNASALHWAGIAPLSRVVGIAGFSTPFAGGLLWYTPLPGDPVDYPAGGNLDFPARELYIGIDS
jgi:hypothetical protein